MESLGNESATNPANHWHQLDAIERRKMLAEHIVLEVRRLARIEESALSPETRLADTGIDSLGGMELIGSIERQFGVAIPITTLLGSATLDDLVAQIELDGHNGDRSSAASLRVRSQAQKIHTTLLRDWRVPAPLFLIPGLNGTAYYLSPLCKSFDMDRACIAFQAPGIDGLEAPLGSIEEMARRYIEEMRSIQPHGPYAIAGHSFGGVIAYEMAQRLAEQGETVEPLMLLDTAVSESEDGVDQSDEIMALFEFIGVFNRFSGQPPIRAELLALPIDEQRRTLWSMLGSNPAAADVIEVYRKNMIAMLRYRPRPYAGPVILYRSVDGFPAEAVHPDRRVRHEFGTPALGWDKFCSDLRIIDVPGDHFTMVMPPQANPLVASLQEVLKPRVDMVIGSDRLQPTVPARADGRALLIDKAHIHFDPHHPDFREDPYPFLNQMRDHTPIFRDALLQWWVPRHADVSAGLRNKLLSVDPRSLDHTRDIGGGSAKPSALSSWFRNQKDSPLARLYNGFLLFLDAPKHTLLRKALSPLFSQESVRNLTGYIDERVETLIAGMRQHPQPDLIHGLALPLPVGVISMIYGVPEEDAAFVTQWARDLGMGLDTGMSLLTLQRAERSADDFTRYLRDHIERLRKDAPHLPHATQLNVDELIRQGVGADELVAHIAMSYFAGFETTTNVIGNGTLALLRHPDQFARLRDDPSLAESATEELLRYDCPVLLVPRFAMHDTEVAGQAIPRGSSVIFMLAAANRDPAVFPNPDRLDITRSAKHHVAFSHGAHYCMGASLARLELQRVFLALSKRRFRLVPGSLAWRKTFGFRGLDQFKIAWQP